MMTDLKEENVAAGNTLTCFYGDKAKHTCATQHADSHDLTQLLFSPRLTGELLLLNETRSKTEEGFMCRVNRLCNFGVMNRRLSELYERRG